MVAADAALDYANSRDGRSVLRLERRRRPAAALPRQQPLEIPDGAGESGVEIDPGRPVERRAGPGDEGNTLPDDTAYDTLDARCQADYARGFLLYSHYTRAAGFRNTPERFQ